MGKKEFTKKYTRATWETQELPPECEELEYTMQLKDEIVVFIYGKIDRYSGGYGYWMICCNGLILDGRGVVSRKESGDHLIGAGQVTIDVIEDFIDYFHRSWKKEWPAPYLVIINRMVYKWLENENEQNYFANVINNDWPRINVMRELIGLGNIGKIAGIVRKRSKRKFSFYIIPVAISYIKLVGRNMKFYKRFHRKYGKKVDHLKPSELMQAMRSSDHDLFKTGYIKQPKPLSELHFLEWVLRKYGEADHPSDVLDDGNTIHFSDISDYLSEEE